MIAESSKLKNFRNKLYSLFPKRKDAIMNLLDAVTAYANKCDSVVKLSAASCFERQYSSITDAIADGLTKAEWSAIRKLMYQAAVGNCDTKPKRLVVDCTPQPRPYSAKLSDRCVTHFPNPAPGNKPIIVGHQYSAVTLLPNDVKAQEKHWVVPLSVQRVESGQKGNEIGMGQIIKTIDELNLADELTISIGDSLYGTEKCRILAAKKNNLVHIFRLNSKRNVFFMPTNQQQNKAKGGRKKEFGAKMKLGSLEARPSCDQKTETKWTSRRGKEYKVIIKCWKNMLLRGSKEFRSSQYPINLIQITVVNEEGGMIFNRPLWLAIFGKKRHDISLTEAYKNYSSRYDIEHFFRFGKRNLLMSSYQTPDVNHEELWWRLCLLAYTQLYLAKKIVKGMPHAWEKYLPEYKNKKQEISTPAQTQRGFKRLLEEIGTPAKKCIARGKAHGRMKGERAKQREDCPVIFKTKKAAPEGKKAILSGLESTGNFSNPQRIMDLVNLVQPLLEKFNLTPPEFSKMLINSS